MTKPTDPSLGTRATHAAHEAVGAGAHALERSRQLAMEAAGRVSETARDLRDDAADLARAGAESVADATVAAQRQLGRLARTARRHVARDPVKSALIAAAIGAVAAALVMAYRARRNRD